MEKAMVRKYKKDPKGTLIIFPEQPGTNNPGTCACWEYIGEHSAGDYNAMIEMTRPVTDQQAEDAIAAYSKLYPDDCRENYKLVKRSGYQDFITRKNNVNKVRG